MDALRRLPDVLELVGEVVRFEKRRMLLTGAAAAFVPGGGRRRLFGRQL